MTLLEVTVMTGVEMTVMMAVVMMVLEVMKIKRRLQIW